MERWRRFGSFVFSLMAGTAFSPATHAQEPSGATVKVVPDANASGVTGSRVLDVPGDIYAGDEVTTARGGEAQIRFVDDTRFVVGPNSRVVIDKFVFDPNRTAVAVSLSAVKGTFRFISGNSPSEAYSIKTPTMTIGVRGTALDFAVRPGGETMVVWLDGAGDICVAPAAAEGGSALGAAKTECIEAAPGTIAIGPPEGGFATPRPGELPQRLATFFPYLGQQNGMAPGFAVNAPGGIPNSRTVGDGDDNVGPDNQTDRPDRYE